MAQALVDTSAIYALLARQDANHHKALTVLRSLPRRGLTPVLSNFIVAETHALLLSRMGSKVARDWLMKQIWTIEAVTASDEKKAKEIIERYDDKTFSYTDATSFALMDRLEIKEAFAFDVHFLQYGLKLLT
ncbi:MAG TPA: PIN domain-containing protein [Candidatus Binatia bacterium]|nr:PIN domain-containing protein [Candidatus Binatia bacterium]